MNITLLDFRNPALRNQLEAAARRERARQIVWLFEKALASLFSRRDRPAARPHFAR
jgi:hypothetical protein